MTNTKCELCEIEDATITKSNIEIGEDAEGNSIDIPVIENVCEACADMYYDG